MRHLVLFSALHLRQATTDPVALYVYLVKSLSDERHDLLEDNRRFTDFVTRYYVQIPHDTATIKYQDACSNCATVSMWHIVAQV